MKIDENTMIPALFSEHPETRAVFDRYGLKGCGGPLGPAETLGFFARAHGVELEQLICELKDSVGGGPIDEVATMESVALEDRIYRRFFITAIAVTLTAGATWGLYLLWLIGEAGSFTALSLHHVNAHGHAQIFGWVALFVMGFACQAFPRFRHGMLWRPELANLSFLLMVIGITARVAGGIFWRQPWGLFAGLAGSVFEVTAVALFTLVIARTLQRAPAPTAPYELYIVSSISWLLTAAIYSGIHFFNTMTAQSARELIHLVSVWQVPLRDVQIYGFAMLMILGVSQRFLPGIYGLRPVHPRRSKTALLLLNLAILVGSVSFVMFRLTGAISAALLREAAAVLILGVVLWLVLPWKLWGQVQDSDRAVKFIRSAYLWLIVSLVLIVLMPVYNWISGIPFSHAYFGAARHAITVGFVTMMILGVASKVVPTLAGVDLRGLTQLNATFILVNLGCFLRVVLQIASDHLTSVFVIIGFSAVLEVLGLTIWGFHLVGIMLYARRNDKVLAQAAGRMVLPGEVEKGSIVADVIECVPGALEFFVQSGFSPLKNAFLRRTMARSVTVEQACRYIGKDPNEFLLHLNKLAGD